MKEIFEHEFCKDLVYRYKVYKKKELGNSLNVFSVSKYGNQLENFHSDILAIFFNQNERHASGLLFVRKFADFLNNFFYKNIQIKNYEHSTCEREKGRVDLLIVDEVSKHCIILENKINDAPDMPDQLKRYYEYATNERNLKVDAIIYLTLNGNKNAPLVGIEKIDDLVVNLSFFNTINNIYSNWLMPCYDEAISNKETSSFIYQYAILLKHISKLEENMDLKKDFYNLISNKDNFLKMEALSSLYNDLHIYRATVFAEKLQNNYKPFTKKYLYKPWHWLYENYTDRTGTNFKLDVHFGKDYARIDFWIPRSTEENNFTKVKAKLIEINKLKDFLPEGYGNGFYKEFNIKDYNSLEEVDNFLHEYVINLLKSLEDLDKMK